MNFVFFDSTQISKSTTPKITVRRGGVLALNENAIKMFGENVTHVEIGYDQDSGAVGLRAATEDARGRYRLRQQKNSTSYIVNAKPLFSHYGLTVEKATSFDVEDFGKGIFGLTLHPTPEKEVKETSKAKKS